MHISLPITFCAASAFLVIMSIYAAPWECFVGLMLALSGVPVYFLCVKYQSHQPQCLDKGVGECCCSAT